MALEYAKRYPAHVSHAILVGTGPSQGPRHMAMAERRWEETVCPERKRLFENDMRQLEADIAAAPDQRFKAFSSASAPKAGTTQPSMPGRCGKG